jgi:hypothetical protein
LSSDPQAVVEHHPETRLRIYEARPDSAKAVRRAAKWGGVAKIRSVLYLSKALYSNRYYYERVWGAYTADGTVVGFLVRSGRGCMMSPPPTYGRLDADPAGSEEFSVP